MAKTESLGSAKLDPWRSSWKLQPADAPKSSVRLIQWYRELHSREEEELRMLEQLRAMDCWDEVLMPTDWTMQNLAAT